MDIVVLHHSINPNIESIIKKRIETVEFYFFLHNSKSFPLLFSELLSCDFPSFTSNSFNTPYSSLTCPLQTFDSSFELDMFRFLRQTNLSITRVSNVKNVGFSSVKDARAARREKLHAASGGRRNIASIAVIGSLGAAAYVAYEFSENPNGVVATQVGKAAKVFDPVKNFFLGNLQEVFEPTTDKILPDWGDQTYYPGVPPGSPAPPLLIVDLEKTLIGSKYDAKHGWRHVKRPGLDKFIKELSGYYEIAIISENDLGIVQDILMAIDPEGRCHKFGSNVSEMRGTAVLKRLDLMNRDLRKIVLIDDDPVASQLFPRNTLLITPFTEKDIYDTDHSLESLIPLLQAFVHEDARDYRDAIDSLGTHDAFQCAIEYRMRVDKKKREEQEKRNRGLGGVIRGAKEVEEDQYRSSILSAKDIVGDLVSESSDSFIPVVKSLNKKEEKGPAEKKKGLLFKRLEEIEKQKEEEEMRKREVMMRIQQERIQKTQQRE